MTTRTRRPFADRSGRAARLLMIGAIALIAAGCRFATEVDITIAADGSGTATSLIQYDSDMAELLGPASQFRDDILDAQAEGADVSIVPASQLSDPYTEGLRYRATFRDADGLRGVLLDGPFDRASVRLDDSTLTIEASFDGTDAGADAMFPGLTPRVTAVVTIDVEGDVTSSDAQRTEGSTHVWEFDLTRDGQLTLTAELGGGTSATLIVLALALLAAGGIGFVMVRSRSGRAGGAPGPDATPSP